MAVLIATASKHGSTGEIASFIAEALRERGVDVAVRAMDDVPTPEGYEAWVIGSAVYVGSWMKAATAFVRDHQEVLAARPVWLFSSGPLGADISDLEAQPKELPELVELIHPREHRMFFGALSKEKLGFGERMMVKAVKAPEGDFREWDEIRSWAEAIASEVLGSSVR